MSATSVFFLIYGIMAAIKLYGWLYQRYWLQLLVYAARGMGLLAPELDYFALMNGGWLIMGYGFCGACIAFQCALPHPVLQPAAHVATILGAVLLISEGALWAVGA